MTELAYRCARNGRNTHTITRATGTTKLASTLEPVIVTILGSLTPRLALEALQAARWAFNRDAMAASAVDDHPTSGSVTL